ncbi:MAG: hypothetical protein ACXVP0_13185 [Bacteroidia bacterium]
MKLHALVILFFCTTASLRAQDSILVKRPAFELKLAVDSGAFYKAYMKASDYMVSEGTLQIFPGETLLVEADVEQDRLVDLKVVPQIRHAEKTMRISFKQTTEGKLHKFMLLEISNPFDSELRYNTDMNLMESGQWAKTPVLPVKPGISAIETWPDIITSLALSDFVLRKR